ncbi:hypothetical protein HN873_013538, partial [Arachis hypogaea]
MRNRTEGDVKLVRPHKPVKRKRAAKIKKETGPSKRPLIDTTYSVDHIPCSKNRKKKSMSRHLSSLTTSPAKPSPEVVDLTADTDGDPPAFHVEANVKRARDGLTGRHMCNDQLPGAHDVVNLGSLLSLKVERIPQ